MEALLDEADAAETANDLERFLRSEVTCIQIQGRRHIAKETYILKDVLIDKVPLKLTGSGRGSTLFGKKRTIAFKPWLNK